MRCLPALLALALLGACAPTPEAPVGVAASAAPAAADAVPLLGLPVKAVVNNKPLAGYALSILDPLTDKPLPVVDTPPASGSAIIASEPPKTAADGSFKFKLVLDKAQGIISNNGGSLIAGGGGNLIAGGGGNLLAGGGGNLIAGGGGNLISNNSSSLISNNSGSLISNNSGSLIAGGGGNLIAGGGGNLASSDVNLRVVAAGLGGRVEAVSTLSSAGFGRVYRTLQVQGDIIMDVASTITARLALTALKKAQGLSPEERQKLLADTSTQLNNLHAKLDAALAAHPELATQILQSGEENATVDTDALIGTFLATAGLTAEVPGLLNPAMSAAAAVTPPGGPTSGPPSNTNNNTSTGNGGAGAGGTTPSDDLPTVTTVDLH